MSAFKQEGVVIELGMFQRGEQGYDMLYRFSVVDDGQCLLEGTVPFNGEFLRSIIHLLEEAIRREEAGLGSNH